MKTRLYQKKTEIHVQTYKEKGKMDNLIFDASLYG